MPRGSTIESDIVFGVICQLPLLQEEFGIATLTFHSDLRRRAASRWALSCRSSYLFFLQIAITLCSVGKDHLQNDFKSKSKSLVQKDQNQNHKDIMHLLQHNIYVQKFSEIVPL